MLPQATQHLTTSVWGELIWFTLFYFELSNSFRAVAEWLFFDQHYHSIPLPEASGVHYNFVSARFKIYHLEMSPTLNRTIFYLLAFSEPDIVPTTESPHDYKKTFQNGQSERQKRIRQIEEQCTLSLLDWPISLVRFLLLPYVILL